MEIDVPLLPSLVTEPQRRVCIVVDVLRASTSLVTMFERGIAEVVVTDDLDDAHRLRDALGPDVLLCGEVRGHPPEGFDYGNSPVEFHGLDLAGRRAVLFTTNGTAALTRLAGAGAVLVGALRNRTAVARAALAEAAARRLDIAVVCAGNGAGTRFSLDDAVAAGAIAETCLRLAADLAPGTELGPTDAATAARRLYHSYDAGILYAFRTSEHGRFVIEQGLAADLPFCAEPDRAAAVPRLQVRDGHAVLIPGP